MFRKMFFIGLFCGITAVGFAQFYPTQYRPPNLNWQQLKTPHFRIIYPVGEDSVALRSGRILESQYNRAIQLTGGTLSKFPVLLNNYNDRSNGFVTSLHFRSEIDIHNFKGKSLNPRSGNWLETVEPHELIHATQFNNMGTFGLGTVLNLFSPDLARSIHGAIPAGIDEGLAVYHETEGVAPNGGRGNYPYFTNVFDSYYDSNSNEPWSMGQIVHRPTRTRPFLRHYMGGFEFTSWLHNSYGDDISRKALDYYAKWPFLGYGFALKKETGKWPAALYDDFKKQKVSENDLKTGRSFKEPEILFIPYEGADIHRPKWLDDSSLVFFGSFYNKKAGFFIYRLERREISRIYTTNIVQDYQYDLSADKSKILYSYYKASPIYDNTFKTQLAEIELSTQKRSDKPAGKLYAPSYDSLQILALAHRNASNSLVSYNTKNKITELANLKMDKIIQVEVNPANPDQWAVVANKRGLQALWIINRNTIQRDLQNPPNVSFKKASVFDPAWHSEGNRLLFTADIGISMNIYEYNIKKEQVKQLTHTRYNSYEASYNKEGNQIAFVQQVKNKAFPAVLPADAFYGALIDSSLWMPTEEKITFAQRPELGNNIDTSSEKWETSSYSPGLSWLKPRAVFPVFEEVSNQNIYRAGVQIHSNDVLQSQAYSADLFWLKDRVWYDLTYRNKQFFPGFKSRVFSEPGFRSLTFLTSEGDITQTILQQERSMALSIPIPVTLENNITFSSFKIEPEFRFSQIRFSQFEPATRPVSDFTNIPIVNVSASFSYKLQQNLRDVQPNSGIFLFTETEQRLSSGNQEINMLGSTFHTSITNAGAVAGGIFAYFAPLNRWNQSLRVGLSGLTQTGPVFDNQFLVSDGFSEPVFNGSDHLISLSTRYTIPLWYPDDGGFLVPLYLSNLYLVAFSNTVKPTTEPGFLESSRTVLGLGLRAQFKLSNLSFDIGFGFGFEPTRNKLNVFAGDF